MEQDITEPDRLRVVWNNGVKVVTFLNCLKDIPHKNWRGRRESNPHHPITVIQIRSLARYDLKDPMVACEID